MARPYRVLSIDGGGIRGVIPAALLTEIEQRTGKRIAEMFDLVAGTSTGGIIAVGLTAPDQAGKTKYRAADLLDLYESHGQEIFTRSFWKGITSVGGVSDEKYDAGNLERVLNQYLGDAQLKDAVCDLLVTSYDIERRRPYYFKRIRARESGDRNHLLRVVARATSAAPTYFQPAIVHAIGGATVRYLIDGGVFANNPALCAYAEACDLKRPANEIFVLSLGTGINTRKIAYDDAKDWGLIGWVRPVISVMMDGVADAVDYQLTQLLTAALVYDVDDQPALGADAPRYYRFDIRLENALDDMDAANRANIDALKGEAQRIIDHPQMKPAFDRLCDELRAT